MLAGILLGGMALRLAGVGWGSPNYDPALLLRSPYRHSYHLDEYKYLWPLATLQPAAGDFDIKDYHWGSLQFYLIYGALGLGEAVGWLPTPWGAAFVRGDAAALPRIYVLGRLVSVAAGTVTMGLVAALGTRLGGRKAGLFAAAAYALAPLAVVESDYLTDDVTMSTLVAAAVLAGVAATDRGVRRGLVGMGLLLGLATAAKYSAIFAAPALLAAQGIAWRRAPPTWPGAGLALILAPWLAVAGGFLLGEPYALLAPGAVRQGLALAAEGNALDPASGFLAPLGMLRWQGTYLAELGLTWPLALLAAGGLIGLAATLIERPSRILDFGPFAALKGTRWIWREREDGAGSNTQHPKLKIRQRRAGAAILLAALGGLGIGLALNRVFMLRYSQPLVPLLATAAGVGWAMMPRPGWRMVAGALALGVAAWMTLGQVALLTGPHPANMLLAWLNERLEPGQQVAQLWPVYPVLDADRFRLIRLDPWRPDLPPGNRPDYIILDDMQLGPATPRLLERLRAEYRPVARFGAQPHVGPFAWDEGTTPHDWKYSHPTFVVYARTDGGSRR